MATLLTADAAQAFEYYSTAHAALLESTCPNCKAYQDWFTYNSWQALGFQVQKDEHGIPLETWVKKVKTDKDGNEKVIEFPKITRVFCRHQVKPKESN